MMGFKNLSNASKWLVLVVAILLVASAGCLLIAWYQAIEVFTSGDLNILVAVIFFVALLVTTVVFLMFLYKVFFVFDFTPRKKGDKGKEDTSDHIKTVQTTGSED